MILNNNPINVLIAYPYFTKELEDYIVGTKKTFRVLIDSGAFTAWKSGQTIKLDDYCTFIEKLLFKPFKYFMLDVIGDPVQTQKNYEIMLARGFNPIPIFTRGEDVSMLDQYYKTSDIVGIGGLVGTKKNKQFVNGLMKKINGRKVHWLGFTNIEYIKYYKPFMCDSTAWLTARRYASTSLYLGNGQFTKLNKTDLVKQQNFMNGTHKKIKDTLTKYGFNYFDLLKSQAWRGGDSIIANICSTSAIKLSNDLETTINTKLFLAGVNLFDLKQFQRNYQRLKGV